MARLTTRIRIENDRDPAAAIECEALIDTGATHLTLPTAWRERLGDLRLLRTVRAELANQEEVEAEVRGPVLVRLDGFEWVGTEVMFLEMRSHDGGDGFEPLVGHLVLEHCGAAIDMERHRLVPARAFDLKRL